VFYDDALYIYISLTDLHRTKSASLLRRIFEFDVTISRVGQCTVQLRYVIVICDLWFLIMLDDRPTSHDIVVVLITQHVY